VVYIVDGQAYTATANAGDTVRPPTPGTRQVLTSPTPPTVITDVNTQLDQAGRGSRQFTTATGQTAIVTVEPINEQPQGGDPFKLPEFEETPINGASAN
jgi:hypothetical protein